MGLAFDSARMIAGWLTTMWNIGELLSVVRAFGGSRRGNVAVIFALSIVPIGIAAGTGLDMARAMIVRARLSEALDSAGLAIGSASVSSPNMTQGQLQVLAQQYFDANYVVDRSFGIPAPLTVNIVDKTATLSSSVAMPTALVRLGDLIGCTKCDSVTVGVSSNVVWDTTKLWVGLALDNTGSMKETDRTGTSKISALKTGAHQLLTIMQNAAATPGDVQVAILPFSKDVNVGAGKVSENWIDWADWSAAPQDSQPPADVGPGSRCPYSWSTNGFVCTKGAPNDPGCFNAGSNDCVAAVPTSGLICPSQHKASVDTGQGGHFYNGCYDSVKQNPACASNCLYNHTWVPNARSSWTGCIMDRNHDYDVQNTAPMGSGTNFPAENAASCPPATVMGLSYDWASLNSKVDSMAAQGSTNQTVGLAWGWQALAQGDPLHAPALPKDTARYMILLSDGLNTQDRWHGDGADHDTSVDARMTKVCDNVKAAGVVVYAIFVDLNGTQGNSSVLQNCASDPNKYFDLTTSGQVITTFQAIAHQIVQLRVAQ
jgi:Flp pilus assembly protein TadG